MLKNQFSRFLRDERGSYTLWSLVWFILYVGIGGLAVDMTDGYRNQTLLQSTADAAALAGVISLPDQGDAVTQALTYATNNMPQDGYGVVLTEEDVMVGTWHFASATFTPGTADPNAVFVTTRREEQNGNPVIMSFLRIMQLWGFEPWMDVTARAVAVRGIHKCHDDGHIAYTTLEIQPRTNYHNDICLIGREGVKFAGGGGPAPEFDTGVYIGVGCESGCVGPANLPFKNDDFNLAFDSTGDPTTGNYQDGTLPAHAQLTDEFITLTQDVAISGNFDQFEVQGGGAIDYSGLEFLADADGAMNYVKVPSAEVPTLPAPEDLAQFTVYDVDCSGRYTLPEGTYQANVGLIFDCPLRFDGDYGLGNTLIATTDTTGQCFGDCNNPQGPYAIDAPGQVSLGASCDDGLLILSMGGVRFAAAADASGTTILAQGNIKFAADGDGYTGTHMESTGGIHAAAGGSTESHWGPCNGAGGGPKVFTYSLVR